MAYDRYGQDLKKAGMAKAMNTASDKFRAMREARVKQERDREIFSLDKQQKQLELKKMEMDPTIDPGYRSIVQKKIKLGMQEADLQLKKQQKALDYQTYDAQQQIEHLGKQAAALNQLTEQNPEMFGDMMIVPDMETGTVALKPRKASLIKTNAEIEKNKSITQRQRVETARKMAQDQFGTVDEAKFQQYLKNLNEGGIGSAAPETVVPAWVPQGKEEQYKQAKQHYSDDEIKQYLGA